MQTLVLTAALAAMAIAAPQRPAPPHQRAATVTPSAPARLTDAEIDAAIRAKLAKSKIAVDKFQYHVQHGVVTIEGKTDVIQHKGAATRLARSAGAVAVSNHVQISEAAREKAAANLASGRRRAQVTRGEGRSQTSSAAPRSSAAGKTSNASGQNR